MLRGSALPVPESVARREAEAAVAELGDGAAHVVSAGWTVPLPWFALVDPEERQLRLGRPAPRVVARADGPGAGPGGAGRADRAHTVSATAAPRTSSPRPATWLARFDRSSVVELDYGGLVELVDDEALRNDDSADQVRDALQALREGDTDAARASYDRLREFWAVVAGKQRSC